MFTGPVVCKKRQSCGGDDDDDYDGNDETNGDAVQQRLHAGGVHAAGGGVGQRPAARPRLGETTAQGASPRVPETGSVCV